MNWHGYPINGWGGTPDGMFTFLGLMTTGAVLLASRSGRPDGAEIAQLEARTRADTRRSVRPRTLTTQELRMTHEHSNCPDRRGHHPHV